MMARITGQSGGTSPKSPTVSIIVPAFNVSNYIAEAVASALDQTYSDSEIIVLNDGSEDEPLLKQALTPFSDRIIYLSQKNQGVGAARNTALQVARGQYVAFLDADDVWLPHKLNEQFEFLNSGNYDMVYSDALLIGESPWPEGTTYMDKSPSESDVNLESLLALRCSVLLSTVVVRREMVIKAGSFDVDRTIVEDFDLWLRLAIIGARINYQRKILAKYRYRAGSLSSNASHLHAAALRTLGKLHGDSRLSAAERLALETTETKLKSAFSLEASKRMILEGDFANAIELLSESWRITRSWKVLVALIGLRTGPQLLQRLYKDIHDRRTSTETHA
jgi:glycosyltransferase involved in cell wall biosynthesis